MKNKPAERHQLFLKMKSISFCFIFFLLAHIVPGQNFRVGIETDYGKIYNLRKVFHSSDLSVNNCLVGLCLSYSIPETYFVQNLNIVFQRAGTDSKSIDFIQIPVGMDIVQGKKVQGIIGAGWILSYLFYHSTNIYQDFIDYHTDFQLGGYFKVGIKLRFHESWDVSLKGSSKQNLHRFIRNQVSIILEEVHILIKGAMVFQ